MEEGLSMSHKYPLMLIVILCLTSCLICNIYAYNSPALSNEEVSEQITRQETHNFLFEEKDENPLNTFHRTIGFIPLFIIAVLGLGSYFTHRRYEHDKMLLICVIKSEIAKVRAELERRYSDFEKKAQNDLEGKIKSLEESLRSIAESVSFDAIKPIDERTKLLMGHRIILQIEFSSLEAE